MYVAIAEVGLVYGTQVGENIYSHVYQGKIEMKPFRCKVLTSD